MRFLAATVHVLHTAAEEGELRVAGIAALAAAVDRPAVEVTALLGLGGVGIEAHFAVILDAVCVGVDENSRLVFASFKDQRRAVRKCAVVNRGRMRYNKEKAFRRFVTTAESEVFICSE